MVTEGRRAQIVHALRRFATDSAGQDLIEYALLGGLIATAGLLVLPDIVAKMSGAYTAWVEGVKEIAEPCPPSPMSCP